MNEKDFYMREVMFERRTQRPKCIHKKWVGLLAGAKAVVTDLFLASQLALLAFLYAFFAYYYCIFFYISLGLTFFAAVHVFICERDAQSKSSWLFLFIASFGCGYIVYLLADKRVCYGYDKRRFAEIMKRSEPFVGEYSLGNASISVANDCEYIYKSGGYIPYTNTEVKYFSDARHFFDNILTRLESAERFVFLEFFIVSDGVLLERLLSVLRRKVSQGVEVRMLYDDAGCQGVLSQEMKKRIRAAGINLKVFARMFAPFSFGLNYRDHRKIVVIDGKTGYVGGCNIADECTNEVKMNGYWKDAGVKMEGAAVDGLSLTFLRQWEFATRVRTDFAEYLNHYEKKISDSTVVPYAGGPEIDEALCRGVYANLIAGAQEKLYIMTPYFIPDGDVMNAIKAKALSGVDVRLVLPSVPDYGFIYKVTRANAERMMKNGVKVYFVRSAFVHSKIVLTENATAVGSVNMDMRAFYQEFDNGVYTDDKALMNDVAEDFNEVFANNCEQVPAKHNIFSQLITACLRVVSPLM